MKARRRLPKVVMDFDSFVEIESEGGDGESTEMSAPESTSAVNARC